ncbi:MAG: hypothetical protein EU532_13890 [Promethearchaeota archaeon]|nr:MAG: hypothetical protein EU532_13890 [Candidatus Lokiarchaeota archaeon]
MNNITYKVIFRDLEESETSEESLTFKNVISTNYIFIPSNFITSMKDLSEKSENVIYFQNISEVIIQNWGHNPPSFNYYIVLLLLSKREEKKEGYLIGNIKKLKGDVLMGIWPFNRDVEKINSKSIQNDFNKLLNNYEEYRKITIIHS